MAEGAVTLTFDDGFLKTTNFARDILDNYEIKGCFFIPVGFIGKKFKGDSKKHDAVSWRDLEKLVENGHEIGSHGFYHENIPNDFFSLKLKVESEMLHIIQSFNIQKEKAIYYISDFLRKFYNQISSQDANEIRLNYNVETELLKSKEILENNLDTCVRSFAYPGGNFSKNILEHISSTYDYARTTRLGLNNFKKESRYTLKSKVWDIHTSVDEVNKWVELCMKRGYWLIETFHVICEEEKDYRYRTSEKIFMDHIRFLKKKKVRVLNFCDLEKVSQFK